MTVSEETIVASNLLWRGCLTGAAFVRHAVVRFVADGCLTAAGALSYTTLVSLVPLTAIALAVLSAFPIFADTREQLIEALSANLVPDSGVSGEVRYWIQYFAATAVKTTTLGIGALAVAVILLLATIEDQFHIVWRVRSRRPWPQRVLVYWAILTLGPILLAISFSLPGYVDLLAQRTGIDPSAFLEGEPWSETLVRVVPFLLELFVFSLFYAFIPSYAVRWRDAFVGAVVAAALLEALKAGFALYVSSLSTYRAVYGAVAVIPLFLLWMYVAWAVVLFGAVVAAGLPRWRIDEKGVAAASAILRLGVAIAVLSDLEAQSRRGGSLGTMAAADRLGAAAVAIEEVLMLLQQARMVAATIDGGWVLARSLANITLGELYKSLHLPLAASLQGTPYPWKARIAHAVQRIADAEAEIFSQPLSELLGPETEPFDLGPQRRSIFRRRR
jgi:membrane protein